MTAKVIEFLGMPRAGKTTQINKLKFLLDKKGFKVAIICDRDIALRIHTPVQERVAFELVFFSLVLDEYFANKDNCDYILIDRGMYDTSTWFDTLLYQDVISAERNRELRQTFSEYRSIIDKVVCIMVEVEESLKRHTQTEHQKCDDVGMDIATLKALAKAYEANKSDFTNCLFVDGIEDIETQHKKISEFCYPSR